MNSVMLYLGYVVGQGQIKPIYAKISVICNFPQPKNKKQLMHYWQWLVITENSVKTLLLYYRTVDAPIE